MSSAVGEDTMQTVAAGRETVGAMLRSAQLHLQKIFIVFVAGFLGSFYALRLYIWEFLEETAKAEMEPYVEGSTDLITVTPFEVILLQAKIGIIMGIILALPVVLYFSREALYRRGVESVVPVSRGYMVGFALAAFGLFWGGIVYAYGIFFPYAFDFLATNAVETGVKPSFGITEFTHFVVLLTISFGLAAQLPLIMSVLSYTEIVSYETFRNRWRHAILGIFVFGMLFSPPDPFTQIMWALPLVVLYVLSLGISKVVTNVRRRGAAELDGSGASLVKRRALQFAAIVGVAFAAASALFVELGAETIEATLYPLLPDLLTPSEPTTIEALSLEHGLAGDLAAGGILALGVGLIVLLAYTISVLQEPVYPREATLRAGDIEKIDFDVLDVSAIEDLSTEVFVELDEEQALEYARDAMYEEDREKAQTILDRFDTAQEIAAGRGEGDGEAADALDGESGESTEADDSLFASTAAGMVDPFTEDETTEDDIGGFAYDLLFIFQSLTSKMFSLVGTFMVVMAGTFFWLYTGGLRGVLEQFLGQVPESVLHEVAIRNGVDPEGMGLSQLVEQMDIVIALHPVEVLIFNVKISVIVGFLTVLPMIFYFGWPAIKERGLAYGDRRIFLVWGGSLFGGFVAGTYLGFFFIAPAIISYLVTDVITAGMVVSFRISSFFWLVIYTTLGIGFLFNVIVTMALFHVGGIVSYRRMLASWRPIVLAIFVLAAFFSPSGILTMLMLATPVAITYVLGLGVLYVLTAGGRLFGGEGGDEGGLIDPRLDD